MKPILSELSRRRKLHLLLRHLPVGSRVLEVGSGDQWFSRQLRKAGMQVTTLDLKPPADIVGNILHWRNLGIKSGQFDAVVALEVIEHVDCIESLKALCRDEGLLFLSSPLPSGDRFMRWLEKLHLTQHRTSPHCNLTDFRTLPLVPLVLKRPLFIHQVGLFLNRRPAIQ